MQVGLQRSREAAYYLFYAFFVGELAALLAATARIDEGLVEIDAALRHAETSESLWCMPEILRVKGELLAARADGKERAAEECFMQSLDLARRQEARTWELRSAMSLARFWRKGDRTGEARALLDAVFSRFTEGFDTTDLKAARRLLAQLS